MYEASSLDRVTKRYGAGAAWYSGHPVATAYLTNTSTAGNVLSCKLYTTDGETLSGGSTCYNAQKLYVTKTTDEDGNIGYTFTDQPATVTITHTASGKLTQTEVYTYTYDHSDRISSVTHKLNSNTAVTLASYTYDSFGRIATKKLHGSSTNQLTYAYNIRSWLTGITGGKFTQTLGYGSHYNGNISTMNWTDNDSSHSYSFTYDGLNRMLNATHGTGAYTEKVTSYDKNGNINGLQRYDNSSLVDNLSYTYNGNQLTKVEDATGNTAGFTNGASQANEYTYDFNGNLTKDLNKGITNISYNVLSLPQVVTLSNGSTVTYLYTADGRKLRTIHVVNGTTTTTDYCGNVIYENGTQKLLLTEEGYVDLVNSNAYYYYLKDHQGNNRVVVSSSGTVVEINHYYPFGGSFATSSNVQPYKYNGKELDTKNGLNWYDYGARYYDAALGRFTTIDPLGEKDYLNAPYNYCGNNPIVRIDREGKIWDTIWDIGNVIYDIGAAVVNHIKGDHVQAQSHWTDAGVDALAMVVPGLPAGATKALKLTDKGVDAVKAVNKVDDANNVMKNRVKLRKGTKETVEKTAAKTDDGLFIDPNTNLPIEEGQEVFGHKPGHEWGKYKKDPINQKKTRKEVIEDQNNPDIYQIEDKKSNASHRYEEKWRR